MHRKTYDFLVRMRAPVVTDGGEALGEAIEAAMELYRTRKPVSLNEIELTVADKFNATVGAIDSQMRRAVHTAEYRSGRFPNEELDRLKAEWGIDTISLKKFICGSARYLLNERGNSYE